MAGVTMVEVRTPNLPKDDYPFRFTDFATSASTIWADDKLTVLWSSANNWFYFNTSGSGDYIHHTLRKGTGGENIYTHNAAVVGATSNIYLSNDGSTPGTTYSATNPNTSTTFLTFVPTSGATRSLEITVSSLRGTNVTSTSQAMFGKVERLVASNSTPAE